MKRRLIMFCYAFLICVVLSLSVSAEEISLMTIVPDSHEVFISVVGDGFVKADNDRIIHGKLTVRHQKAQEYCFISEGGYKLEKLFYNGKDVTAQVIEDRFIAAPLTSDSRMTVYFTKSMGPEKDVSSVSPDDDFFLTGESERSAVFIVIFLVSFGAIAACLIIRKKRADK